MAEWFKAAVLKTVEFQSSVGSNPTPSATHSRPAKKDDPLESALLFSGKWVNIRQNVTIRLQKTKRHPPMRVCGEMAELAEGARLLSECRV